MVAALIKPCTPALRDKSHVPRWAAERTHPLAPIHVCRLQQEAMDKLAKGRGSGHSAASLNNVLMQMRKNCNHPDLITGPYDGGWWRGRSAAGGSRVAAGADRQHERDYLARSC